MFVESPQFENSNIQYSADIAKLLRVAGEDAQADALINAALAWHKANHPAGVWGYLLNIIDVELLAIAGQEQEALERLAAAVDYGWRADWPFFINNRNLESIADDVEFKRLSAVLASDMARQRDAIMALPDLGEYDLRDKKNE